MTSSKQKAFDKLGIPHDNKVIICLDGGGIRGILTLQLLKKMEKITGIPCYDLADFVAGTSTGGIIAGLMAQSKSAIQIEDLYKNLVSKVFKKRSLTSGRFLNPPEYTKVNYRSELYAEIGNKTLEQACSKSGIDLLITAKDVAAGEETFFTCFKYNNQFHGTYKDTLLRSAMEATMSAPTYFSPLERFVDGGTTTYNNPTLAALMEAIHYTEGDKYDISKVTLFSFGTGTTMNFYTPDEIEDPRGLDAFFWLNFVMHESSQDASEMQINLIRSKLFPKLDFRRFQLSLDESTIKELPDRKIQKIYNIKADWLRELTNDEIKGIALDDVGMFPIMEALGQSMTDYIMNHGAFKTDLTNDKGKDLLISRAWNTERIKSQMSDPDWLKNQPL